MSHISDACPIEGEWDICATPASERANPTRAGRTECNRRLGGLLKVYYRKAG